MVKGPVTRCDVVHPRSDADTACNTKILQHVDNFAPDYLIFQLFIVRSSYSFPHNDEHLI